jgi:hypothetical protein
MCLLLLVLVWGPRGFALAQGAHQLALAVDDCEMRRKLQLVMQEGGGRAERAEEASKTTQTYGLWGKRL